MEAYEASTAIRIENKSLTLQHFLQRAKVNRLEPLLAELTRELVIECWAEELGIETDKGELQAAITEFRKNKELFTAAETKEWLSTRGLELGDLAEALQPALLEAALKEAVVSEEEIERYFHQHVLHFDRAEISRLVMEDHGGAQELLFRVEEGADFHQLARQYSNDPETARVGGYLGLISRAEIEPDSAAAIFSSSPGSVVGPFERKRSFHLILVEQLYPACLDDTTRADIRDLLFENKLEQYQQSLTIEEGIWSL